MADRLLFSASRTLNPKTILKGLYYYLFGSIKRFFVSLFFSIGYLMAITFGIMAILKPFFPNNVGVFLDKDGFLNIGIIGDSSSLQTDILGYWIIPIGIVICLLIYLGLTKKLAILKRLKKD